MEGVSVFFRFCRICHSVFSLFSVEWENVAHVGHSQIAKCDTIVPVMETIAKTASELSRD